jgi:site-specific recombinase XerD
VRHSLLVKVVDAHRWSKKSYNNAVSALRRAFEFGYRDHPEQHNPATALKSARIGRKDRPRIDPFTIQDAETLIAGDSSGLGRSAGELR